MPTNASKYYNYKNTLFISAIEYNDLKILRFGYLLLSV